MKRSQEDWLHSRRNPLESVPDYNWAGKVIATCTSAHNAVIEEAMVMHEVRASQLAQASERVGSPIPTSQQG